MKLLHNLFALFFCLSSGYLSAQSGSYKRIDSIPVFQQNGIPLKNPWAGGLNYPLFSEIDLNGDGLKDLFEFDKSNGRIECFINQGTADSVDYKYSSAYFSNFPYLHDWVLFHDYNCDGKEDIFAFSDNYIGIKVYENISSGGTLQFRLVTPLLTSVNNSNIDTIRINSLAYPALIDVDNDGDMDILYLSSCYPRSVDYYKNMSEENGWGCDSLKFQFETACWGNFAFSQGPNTVGTWNTPNCCLTARYAKPYRIDYDPGSAAPRDDSVTNIFAFDENGDGAKDLLIGDIASPYSLLVVNGGTPAAANMVSEDTTFPSYDTPINDASFTNHAYIDVDNDGKKDLLVSPSNESDNSSILFYKNDSTTAVPRFSFHSNLFLEDGMIDVGEGCYPVFFDYDNDGLMDIVIGNNFYNPQLDGVGTALSLYKNVGTTTSPAFQLVTTDYGNISSLNLTGAIYPAFGDMNGDGKPDLILGCGDGTLQYFENTAPSGMPANFVLTTVNYFNFHIGQYATPQIIDLDRDGVPDLVIGSRNGYLKYYRNTGTKDAANFSTTPTNDSLGMANTSFGTTGFSIPFIYNDSGAYKMFLAGEKGIVLHYDHIDGNLTGVFNLTDTIINQSEGDRLSVSGADINSDGKIDLVVGNYAGGAGIFSQSLPLAVQSFTETKPTFELSPNPATNLLTVRLYNMKETDAKINIVDMLGRTVKNTSVNTTTINLDVSYLSDGIYIVELQSAKFHVTRKLIIQH